jgi:hypothetical protein
MITRWIGRVEHKAGNENAVKESVKPLSNKSPLGRVGRRLTARIILKCGLQKWFPNTMD